MDINIIFDYISLGMRASLGLFMIVIIILFGMFSDERFKNKNMLLYIFYIDVLLMIISLILNILSLR